MITVALLIVAKYNTAQFHSLIDASRTYVDETLVAIDTESEPGILGYRSNAEVQYFERRLNADFATQRNFLKLHSHSHWLLFLDTDENLDPWLWQNLRVIADSTVEDGISLPCRNNIIDFQDYMGWPDYHLRMHRRTGRIRWEQALHTHLVEVHGIRSLPMELRYAIHHTKTKEMQNRTEIFNAGVQNREPHLIP